MRLNLTICLLFAMGAYYLEAQTIRGLVHDKITEAPLPGALVDLPDLSEPRGAVTDENGRFAIKNLAPGRYQVRVRYLGFEDEVLPDVLVTSGKDSEVAFYLEEASEAVQTVTISGNKKTKPVNRLAKVSAIALNPESIGRYSGGRSNVARMAGNFAGIAATDDYQNNLVVRGNSPTGLLWRLDGVPIPNPGHLSTYGNSGGSFNALNPNLLGQSDFLTGAFPAEYGNTIAGVMDMNFRAGNKERNEFTAQVGAWSGVEAAAEGPLWRKQNGSFLLGYRYSFVDLLRGLGVRAGGEYVPQYQDLNWKLDFGKGRHRLALFGLAGQSNIIVSGKDVDPENLFHPPLRDSELGSTINITGARYQWLIDSVSFLRTVVAYCHNNMYSKGWELEENGSRFQWLDETNRENSIRLNSLWQRRQTKRLTLRAGVQAQNTHVNTNLFTRRDISEYQPVRDYSGGLWLLEAFAQMQYKVKKRYSVNLGLHTQHLPLSGKTSVEPRATLKLKLPDDNDLIFAYGYHSQTIAPAALFFVDASGAAPNRRLDFQRSHQGVVAWAKKWNSGWRMRTEAYFQWQTRIPIRSNTSDGFSLLNFGSTFGLWDFSDLTSSGNGRNYGLEWTLMKSYRNGFYTLLTASVFQSEYRGSDGIWRNTAFNSQYIANGLLGKEFPVGNRLVLTFDAKLSVSGGRWYTPIDIAKSMAFGDEVYDDTRPYSEQYPIFYRLDAKTGLRYNLRSLTHHLFLDFTNLSNRRNVFAYRYFRGLDGVSTQYQLGFTPDFVYRVQF